MVIRQIPLEKIIPSDPTGRTTKINPEKYPDPICPECTQIHLYKGKYDTSAEKSHKMVLGQ